MIAANQPNDVPNKVIAAAALAIAQGSESPDENVRTFINRAREDLHISEHDHSNRAKAKLSDYLSSLIERSVLADSDAKSILTSIAQAGQLPPLFYDVSFREDFSKPFDGLGVDRRMVIQAVHHPDDYQHLLAKDAVAESLDELSLFMKLISGKGKMAPFWLLVPTVRKGIEQIVQAAWRVYPQDVSLEKAASPLDVLHAFVDVFGVPLTIGGVTGKFIDLVPIQKAAEAEGGMFNMSVPAQIEVFASVSHRVTTDPTLLNVGVGYCIDIRKYRASLAAHGVSVRGPSK